jgi:hypothetical protein
MAKKVKKTKKTKKSKKRFEGRSQEVLKKIYDKKDERSRSQGKSIWKTDCPLAEFIPEKNKDYELFIFPLGEKSDHGFYHDLPVHYSVGVAFDAFVCKQSYLSEPCFRCEDHGEKTAEWRQKTGGKKQGAKYPDDLKSYFPWDRAVYIILDMTSEESMEKGLQLWAAPKEKVHAEIAKKMHNKRKGTFIDITDFEDGRIITVDVGQSGDYPTYSIDFEELDEEIPEEYQEQLLELCEEAEEAGINLDDGGLIKYFLYIPEYDEVKQSHLSGVDTKAAKRAAKSEEEEEEEEEQDEIDTDEIEEEMEGWSKFKIKKAANERWGIELETKGKDAEEVLEELIEMLDEGEYSSGKPECFGKEAYDREECSSCEYEDSCAEETEKSME